jgi:hypothetical protein
MLAQNAGSIHGESFLIGYDRIADRMLCPGALARLAALVRAGALDRELIAGADPARSAQLAARAARLASPRNRRGLAEGLERLLRAAHGQQRRWWAVSERDHLIANAAEIRELAALLRADMPLYAHGIALLELLLGDGTGPAYRGGSAIFAQRLREARAAMGA